MAFRQRNGGMLWRTGAWSGVVLLAALDGALLMLSPTTPGHHDRPDERATRRATATRRTGRRAGLRDGTGCDRSAI